MSAPPLTLEVFSDVVCPWCFIGKRRLGRALDGAAPVITRWRAFELQPGLPPEGVDAESFFLRKFGGAARRDAIFARVASLGRAEGITFDFARMKRAPNTRLAHRAIKLVARESGAVAEDAAVEALFRAHFEEGADLARADEITAAFHRHQVPVGGDDLARALASDEAADAVAAELERAAALGVTGVPFFVAGKFALSGAHPPEVIRQLLDAGREEIPAPV